MILLVASLFLSTFIRGTPTGFFAFALFNSVAQAVASGYLCTAVYAGAALLGGSFLQTVISGQAAAAVAVSAVQVASSLISLWGSPREPGPMQVAKAHDKAEEVAARIFFAVSTIFLVITLGVYAWLERQPFYKSVVSTLEPHCELGNPDERTGLVADDRTNPPTKPTSQVYRVFKQNLIFMFSVAYVFAVTLVCAYCITVIVIQLIGSLTRRFILQSRSAYDPWTWAFIQCCSSRCTSWRSTLEILLGDTAARSRGWLSGLARRFWSWLSYGRCSFPCSSFAMSNVLRQPHQSLRSSTPISFT